MWGAIEDPPIYFCIFLPVAVFMLLAGQDTVGLSQVVYIILVLVWFGARAGTGKHSVTLAAEGKENIKRIY